jgi:hypothetical protein
MYKQLCFKRKERSLELLGNSTPINEVRSPAPHINRTNTINPIIMSIAPTALLLPDPKYAVNIPAMILATANTSINMLKK